MQIIKFPRKGTQNVGLKIENKLILKIRTAGGKKKHKTNKNKSNPPKKTKQNRIWRLNEQNY